MVRAGSTSRPCSRARRVRARWSDAATGATRSTSRSAGAVAIADSGQGDAMTDLALVADIADSLGVIAIVLGGLFAVVQLREFREQRRQAVAVELVRSFSEPEHAN